VDDDDRTYQMFRPLRPVYHITIPVVVLMIVVAIVSGLVFGGALQGHAERVGPEQAPTTQPTVIIEP
jgi:hypothetical protein